jgi:hypothetical protein
MSNTKIIMAVPPRYVVRVSNLVWFYEGHEVVVIIAANGLTACKRKRRSSAAVFSASW